MIGGDFTERTTDFLAQGGQQWVARPAIPVKMGLGLCAVAITELSFLAIWGNKILEYQAQIANPTSDAGWQEGTIWPALQTRRGGRPGCTKVNGRVVIAGGRYAGEPHRSTEVLDLDTGKYEFAEDLTMRRLGFHIVTIRTGGIDSTFAMGAMGDDGPSYLTFVEEFNSDTLAWKPSGGNLLVTRAWLPLHCQDYLSAHSDLTATSLSHL